LASVPDRVAAGEQIVLRPSKRRKLGSVMLALWAALFVAIGILALGDGRPAGLVFVLPSVPFFLYWLVAALPGSSSLNMSRDGFVVRHCFVRRGWTWREAAGFRTRRIDYPRLGGITLVSFSTADPREQPGDFLQELAVRGLTRTTTLPDPYGVAPADLARAMEACRRRFGDEETRADGSDAAADLTRSRVLNAAALAVVVGLLAAAGAYMGVAADEPWRGVSPAVLRALGWVTVAGAAAAVIAMVARRWRHRGTPGGQRSTPVIDAHDEIVRTAIGSGLPESTVNEVVEGRYAFLERASRAEPIDPAAELDWVARHTGVDRTTVQRALAAHDDYLRSAGLMSGPG